MCGETNTSITDSQSRHIARLRAQSYDDFPGRTGWEGVLATVGEEFLQEQSTRHGPPDGQPYGVSVEAHGNPRLVWAIGLTEALAQFLQIDGGVHLAPLVCLDEAVVDAGERLEALLGVGKDSIHLGMLSYIGLEIEETGNHLQIIPYAVVHVTA